MAQKRIRVLLADDHHLFREGLRALLISAADLEVVGEAGDGNEVVPRRWSPTDVILMDLQLPG
jgi:DNA-binding NarL/FixJ family response regulator